ncbi:MAG: hypothetical protein ACT4O1_14890 [Gemmatimonadota bacterium]
MRQIIYRVFAGLIVIAAGFAVYRSVSERDFTTGFEFGIVAPIIGFLLLIPAFTAYTLFGEKAGSRVLHGPNALRTRFFQRYLQAPSELKPPQENAVEEKA